MRPVPGTLTTSLSKEHRSCLNMKTGTLPLSRVQVSRSSWARSSHPSTRPSGFRSAALSGLQRDPRRAHCCSCALNLAASSSPWHLGESILYIRDVHTRPPELVNRGEQEITSTNKTAGHERSSRSANSWQHVAPVTGRVPDRQQDRHVALLRRRERLRPPWIPFDRVVPVLPQVGACFLGEPVGGGHDLTVPAPTRREPCSGPLIASQFGALHTSCTYGC